MNFFSTVGVVVAGLLICGPSNATMFDTEIGPNEIGAVSVALNDNASGACWTNLREVREYAEEKLRSKGYELGKDDRAMIDYTLAISVDGYRLKAAPSCVGSIIVMVTKFSIDDDIAGLHVINFGNIVATSKLEGNLNQRVIEAVQDALDDM